MCIFNKVIEYLRTIPEFFAEIFSNKAASAAVAVLWIRTWITPNNISKSSHLVCY